MGYFNLEENLMSFKITNTDKKETPAKKNITLKNISVRDLVLIDTDTGEDITQVVINELPDNVETVNFKISVDLPDDDTVSKDVDDINDDDVDERE